MCVLISSNHIRRGEELDGLVCPLRHPCLTLLVCERGFSALLSRGSVIIDFAFYSFSFTFVVEFVEIIFLCFLTGISCVGHFYATWF